MAIIEDRPVEVFLASDADMRRMVRAELEEVGLTFEQLQSQAERGQFSSELARRTWSSVRSLAEFVD